jgi:hypothetical protein
MEITEEKRIMKITDTSGKVHEVEGKVITTTDGIDENGIPKVSIEIKVPVVPLGAEAGEIK